MQQRLARLILALICLGALTFAAPARAIAPAEIPNIGSDSSTFIADEAEVLSRINENKLNRKLKQLSQDTGNEVNFVVVRRLNYGDTVETFADTLFESWFPDPEAQSHQTLIVFDTVTNNVAIRTGEAARGLVNDEIAQSIIAETIGIPIRQDNKYNEAFLGASDRLVAVLSGEPDPGPPVEEETINVESTFTKAEDTDTQSSTVWVVGLLIAATVIPMVTYLAYVLMAG